MVPIDCLFCFVSSYTPSRLCGFFLHLLPSFAAERFLPDGVKSDQCVSCVSFPIAQLSPFPLAFSFSLCHPIIKIFIAFLIKRILSFDWISFLCILLTPTPAPILCLFFLPIHFCLMFVEVMCLCLLAAHVSPEIHLANICYSYVIVDSPARRVSSRLVLGSGTTNDIQ